ncbi:MAG: hypothetical protein ACRCZI_00605 [Cetobacterium sp.]
MAQTTKISKNNTAIVKHADGSRAVVLHSTEIVRVYSDGAIKLDNGGWVTVTTATRMNQVANEWGLGFAVGRKKGVMSVRVHATGEEMSFNRKISIISGVLFPNA